jgi:ASC-1-like (ASCH) protein
MQQINQHDYFGKLERSLRTISYCMDDLDITSVSLPLVANESSYLNFLKEYATNEVPEGSPVFEVFNTEKYKDDIAKFQELNKLKDSLSRHSAQFEDVLRGLMTTMANSVQSISALKIASTDKIVFESNKVLYKILKSPYNHYSPVLEASEIERIKNENFNYAEAVNDYVPFQLKDSSKVRYNLLSDTWTAEDGSTTNFPFGVHQIHEEIVAPIVQNLMNETRIERLKIYNHIKDQKISYLNKWHQDTEDFYGRNRAESADLINLMRASLRDYVAAYNTLTSLKKTEDSMAQSGGSLDSTVVTATENSAEVFAAFEIQSKEFQNVQMDFENYMERLKEDIDVKAGKFEHIDYYDALLRDGNSKNIAVASSEVHELEERRKPLITVNPLFAKTSEMLPVPHIEDITYDHISLNLPSIAKNTLRELDEDIVSEPTNNVEVVVSNDDVANSSDIEEEAADNLSNPISDEEIIVPNDEESLSDDLTNEENLESDEENSDEAQESELEIYTEEELGEFSDSDLAAIMDEFDIEPMEDFDRNEAISIILEAQINANKDEDEEDNTNNN